MFFSIARGTRAVHCAFSSSVRLVYAAFVSSPVSFAYTSGWTVMVMAEVFSALVTIYLKDCKSTRGESDKLKLTPLAMILSCKLFNFTQFENAAFVDAPSLYKILRIV